MIVCEILCVYVCTRICAHTCTHALMPGTQDQKKLSDSSGTGLRMSVNHECGWNPTLVLYESNKSSYPLQPHLPYLPNLLNLPNAWTFSTVPHVLIRVALVLMSLLSSKP